MSEMVTVATVQPSWKRLATTTEVHAEVGRYLRLARNKGADLVVLPELLGLMLAIPLAGEAKPGLRESLLGKSTDRSSIWGKLLGALTGGASEMLGGLPAVLPRLVEEHDELLYDTYVELFGTAAREHAVYLVAGSSYVRDDDGETRLVSAVFDRAGELLGHQAKLHLLPGGRQLATPGDELAIFDTEFGRLGVLLGVDVLYPELARALAYRGVTTIACPAATTTPADWHQLRIALAARAQENQIFLAQSFLIGANELRIHQGDTYQGRSAIVAPTPLTPHQDGVLVEVGSAAAEAVVSAEWDFAALRTLWRTASIRPRSELRGSLFEELLQFDYESGATIEERIRALEDTGERPTRPIEVAEPAIETRPETEQVAPDQEPREAVEPPPHEEEPAAEEVTQEVEESKQEVEEEAAKLDEVVRDDEISAKPQD